MDQSGHGALSAGAPDAAEIAKVECPVDRADRVCHLARKFGTLSPTLANLRRDALIEARAAGHRTGVLAKRLSLTPSRISQLTADARPPHAEVNGYVDH